MSIRSNQPELLDGKNIPFKDIRENLRELEIINALLGGHAITLKAFRELAIGTKKIHICEIGCGGGDNLKMIHRWCKKKGIELQVTGIDINPECIAFARDNCREIEHAEWIISDFRTAGIKNRPDIVFASLFCHHFNDTEVSGIMHWMHAHTRLGFFINDLHRHSLAFHSIKMLTRIFSRSHLVRNDAPLSVLRGFRKDELHGMMSKALESDPAASYSLTWHWAFRWMIICPTVSTPDSNARNGNI